MFRFFVLTGLLVFAGFAMTAAAQDTNQRTRDLVASLDKTKYKKKEKVNVSVEVYLDIKNTPAAKANPADYSGLYDADGFRLQLEVASDGSATGSGFDTLVDSGRTLNFELKSARIDGALLPQPRSTTEVAKKALRQHSSIAHRGWAKTRTTWRRPIPSLVLALSSPPKATKPGQPACFWKSADLINVRSLRSSKPGLAMRFWRAQAPPQR